MSKKKKIANAIGTIPWSELRTQLNDLKKAFDEADTTRGGLGSHAFKKFCRDLKVETNAITLNAVLTDHSAGFGEFLTYFVADMMDDALNGLDFDAATEDFEAYDENRDNVIDKFEFHRFTVAAKIPQDQVAESSGILTFTDFIEYKITGKLKNEKGLDGLKRRFDDLIKSNKTAAKKFHGSGKKRLDSSLLPNPMEGSDPKLSCMSVKLTVRHPLESLTMQDIPARDPLQDIVEEGKDDHDDIEADPE